jgi:hypothetical protein
LPSRTAGQDELSLFQAFDKQAQTISISPKYLHGIAMASPEDKQMAGEGILIQNAWCICSPSLLKDLRISGGPGDQPDAGA